MSREIFNVARTQPKDVQHIKLGHFHIIEIECPPARRTAPAAQSTNNERLLLALISKTISSVCSSCRLETDDVMQQQTVYNCLL